mmetsp:Transcript_68552/g.153899  ORF Transcript_68552/g.153899 Transcript_68552/m.153899 type:complete len:330 (+) Transcript_68552:2973-3962(+)
MRVSSSACSLGFARHATSPLGSCRGTHRCPYSRTGWRSTWQRRRTGASLRPPWLRPGTFRSGACRASSVLSTALTTPSCGRCACPLRSCGRCCPLSAWLGESVRGVRSCRCRTCRSSCTATQGHATQSSRASSPPRSRAPAARGSSLVAALRQRSSQRSWRPKRTPSYRAPPPKASSRNRPLSWRLGMLGAPAALGPWPPSSRSPLSTSKTSSSSTVCTSTSSPGRPSSSSTPRLWRGAGSARSAAPVAASSTIVLARRRGYYSSMRREECRPWLRRSPPLNCGVAPSEPESGGCSPLHMPLPHDRFWVPSATQSSPGRSRAPQGSLWV